MNLKLKSDSFPVPSNVHFPTDMNLLCDSLRKSLSVIDKLHDKITLCGWRKRKYIKSRIKKYYRITSEIHRKKGGNYQSRLKRAAKDYLDISKKVSKKLHQSLLESATKTKTDGILELLKELVYYVSMVDKHIDLLERRVLNGEQIPHGEKVFSIFENHAEWLSKGKLNEPVVIGHNALITTDQYQFIVDYEVYEMMTDKTAAIPLGERLSTNFKDDYVLEIISFDRGFYSILAKKALEKTFIKVIMPKPGKKSAVIELEESEELYKKIRKQHSAVESNINELQQNGLKKVTDKGIEGFKRYVSYAVLANNIKRLGKILLDEKRDALTAKIRRKAA